MTDKVLQGRYQLGNLLGKGGMGSVYRGWDMRLRSPVAIKILQPQGDVDPQIRAQQHEQFREEAMILASLRHPHLVHVIDYFIENGQSYLVMNLVEGESLGAAMKRLGPITENQVLVWAGQLLDALNYCHGQGVLHRDIKPDNIIIQPDGRCVLVDFGLVKLWRPQTPNTRTVIKGMGTPAYAPPEQYGLRALHTDPRSDLYSLAATLYHALTGQPPASAPERMAFGTTLNLVFPPALGISTRTAQALTVGLALQPEQRFLDAAAFRQALSPSDTPSIVLRPRRVWLLWGGVGGVGLAAFILILFWWQPWRKAESQAKPSATPQLIVILPPTATDAPPVTSTPEPTISLTPPASETPPPTPTLLPVLPTATLFTTEALLIIRVDTPPQLDGRLEEWANFPAYPSPYLVYSNEAWDGTEDAAALWQLGWDETNLYLAATVTDDNHVQTQTGSQLYRGDCLEVEIDTERDQDFGPGLSPDDFHLLLSAGNFRDVPPSAHRFQGTTNGASATLSGHHILVAAQPTATGYILEATVPWSDLSLMPFSGLVMGLALSISDNDTAAAAIQETLHSNAPTRFSITDPSVWLPVTLVDS